MLINGQHERQISALDRGLLYGDGLFETIAVSDGLPCLWKQHLRRLQEGCTRLNISCPDPDLLLGEVREEAAGEARGVIKLILTRGAGGRGYLAESDPTPTRIVSLLPWPDRDENLRVKGVNVRICKTRLGENPALAGIKHLNRLEQVMARNEWRDPEIFEGIMLDSSGRVIEGTMSNLFLVARDQLWTPVLDESGVHGVMRSQVIDLAAELGIACIEQRMSVALLDEAADVFITNARMGLQPVARIHTNADTLRYERSPLTLQLRAGLAGRGVLECTD